MKAFLKKFFFLLITFFGKLLHMHVCKKNKQESDDDTFHQNYSGDTLKSEEQTDDYK